MASQIAPQMKWICFICTKVLDKEEYYKIHLNVCLKTWSEHERQKKLLQSEQANRDRIQREKSFEDVEMEDVKYAPVLYTIRESI